MSKQVKNMMISVIRDRIGETQDLLVVDVSKLDAVTTNRMRLALQEKQISAMSVKNALARKALGDAGVEGANPYLEGPSTLVWGGEDIVALSKEIAKWAKDLEHLEIKGGTTEGNSLSAADVEALSKSPGRQELIGQVAGLLLSPGARLLGALQGPGGQLVGCLKTIADKEEE